MKANSKKKSHRSSVRRKKTTTRVTVDFPKEEHRRIKAMAALEGVSLQEYIRSRIILEDETILDGEFNSAVRKVIEENKDSLKRLANK